MARTDWALNRPTVNLAMVSSNSYWCGFGGVALLTLWGVGCEAPDGSEGQEMDGFLPRFLRGGLSGGPTFAQPTLGYDPALGFAGCDEQNLKPTSFDPITQGCRLSGNSKVSTLGLQAG